MKKSRFEWTIFLFCLSILLIFLTYVGSEIYRVKNFQKLSQCGLHSEFSFNRSSNPWVSFFDDWKSLRKKQCFLSLTDSSRDYTSIPDRYWPLIDRVVISDYPTQITEHPLPEMPNLTLIRISPKGKKWSADELNTVLDSINAPNLDRLGIQKTPANSSTFGLIGKHFPKLTYLYYEHFAQTRSNIKINEFSILPDLVNLEIMGKLEFEASAIENLIQSGKLESLSLTPYRYSETQTTLLLTNGRFPNLKTLIIDYISSDTLKLIPKFSPNLKHLVLIGQPKASDLERLKKEIPSLVDISEG